LKKKLLKNMINIGPLNKQKLGFTSGTGSWGLVEKGEIVHRGLEMVIYRFLKSHPGVR
jgi:hypothetical protein